MIYGVFTVRDNAVGAFLPPFFVRSKGEAIRAFSSSVNESGHQFNKYAGDYTLYELGEYDDLGGVFASVEPARVVGALEVLEVPFDPVGSRSAEGFGLNGGKPISEPQTRSLPRGVKG